MLLIKRQILLSLVSEEAYSESNATGRNTVSNVSARTRYTMLQLLNK